MPTYKRWQVVVELTFDPVPQELPAGALYRVRLALDTMLKSQSAVNHYHIIQRPKIVAEFD